MTVRGKPGKPKTGFPPFPPPLEIAARFPHSQRFDSSSYIRRRRTLVRQNPPHLRINDLEVGQNKLPKWAEYSCQTHTAAILRSDQCVEPSGGAFRVRS